MPLLAPGHRTITPVNGTVAGGVTARRAAGVLPPLKVGHWGGGGGGGGGGGRGAGRVATAATAGL